MKQLNQILDDFNLNRPSFDVTGTDKNTIHSYVDNFYEKEFKKYLNQKISLLEIGIEFGSSLKLWSEYFKDAEKIIGLDIQNKLLPEHQEIENVNIIFEDAYQKEFADTLGKFDIIIDDGPHTLESQLNAIELYLPKLKKGGVFIIEDIQSEEWIRELQNKYQEVCDLNQFQEISFEFIDLRGIKERYDDLMIVMRYYGV